MSPRDWEIAIQPPYKESAVSEETNEGWDSVAEEDVDLGVSPRWQAYTSRMEVPGGWLYARTLTACVAGFMPNQTMVFVPDPGSLKNSIADGYILAKERGW